LPAGKRDAALLYMAGYIYLIGGRGEGERCSKKNYRYSIKEKKWTQLAESNVALRKPTVCALNGRYICKLGGLNEFDYINKIIEMYDSVTDKWALVRASARNILE
jgi:N-acetylneuraminic acid mutarotase